MKALVRLLLVTALLLPAAISAAQFEGKVSFKMSSGKDKPQELTYLMKGDKVRMEMPAQKGQPMGAVIMDTTKKEMLVMMDEQKMYMAMPLPDAAKEAMEQKDAKLEKTGETEKILGYTATKYIYRDNNGASDLWLAEGLGSFMGMNNGGPGGRGKATAAQAWERALAGKELFPLRVVGHDKNGRESFKMEVTAIDKSSQPAALFTPPADYQKFDMGGMGGMMKGMLGR